MGQPGKELWNMGDVEPSQWDGLRCARPWNEHLGYRCPLSAQTNVIVARKNRISGVFLIFINISVYGTIRQINLQKARDS